MSEWVTCSCCGTGIQDTPETNMDHETRGSDIGFGMCQKCAEWSFNLTMRPIFTRMRESLNETNRDRWDTMEDAAKCRVVERALADGILEWRIR